MRVHVCALTGGECRCVGAHESASRADATAAAAAEIRRVIDAARTGVGGERRQRAATALSRRRQRVARRMVM
jgi:hypothetical protein